MLDGPACVGSFGKHLGVGLSVAQHQPYAFGGDVGYAGPAHHLRAGTRFGVFLIRIEQHDIAATEVCGVGRSLLGEACHEAGHGLPVLLEVLEQQPFVDASCRSLVLQRGEPFGCKAGVFLGLAAYLGQEFLLGEELHEA